MGASRSRRRASLSGRRRLLRSVRPSASLVNETPRLIQVVGDSGSGKTLVVEQAVRRLTRRRLRVAVVKHSHHPPDLRGKDTSRARAAGAVLVLFASRPSFALFRSLPIDLLRALPVDVVLVEGYSRRNFGGPRVRIDRPDQARSVVRLILNAAPRTRCRRILRLDGRPVRAEGIWGLVAGVMDVRGVQVIRRGR